VAVAGIAVAYIVGRDGSAGWQVARVALTIGLTVATVQLVRRRTPARALVLLAVGLPLTAIGVGIGGPHLAKVGVSATTIAGLVALVAGLVLAASGAVAVVRAVRSWRRVAVVPPLLVLTYVVLFSLGQAVAVTNVPRTDVDSTTPADLGLAYQDVEFGAADGVLLSGWYIPSTNGAAVALAHGAGSTRSGTLDHAVVLARHGFGVLLFDARGHGRSDGRAMDFGWYGDDDVRGAVSFLLERPGVVAGRVGAVGLSMGGEEAIGASAADDRIRAVVAEGATNRVAADKAWLSDEYAALGWVQERIEGLTYALTDVLTAADPPTSLRDAVATASVPTLLIAAGDVADEANAGRYIRSGSPDTVELWVVPRTRHTGALDTHPDDWERRVVAFLSEALVTS
jgi:pimeloyl-ACP methyl ester carboxylesterase